MRIFTLIILSLSAIAFCTAQSVDGPIVFGKVRNVSVGPDRSIWLTTQTGNVYYTPHVDSLWLPGLQTNPDVSYAGLAASFDRILFFSKDTALIFGNIRCSPDASDRNCIYRTVDGGLNWHAVQFGDKGAWVRHGQVVGGGVALISASSGRIYRTTDHGATWVTLPKIFGKEKEAYYRAPDLWSFHYMNDSVAIATNRSDHLAVTGNDFTTATRIPTPLDQGLFDRVYKPYYLNGKGRKYVDNWKIDKVRIFRDSYVIMQNGTMYQSGRDKIAWKASSVEVFDFEVDQASGRLFAVTVDQGVGEMDHDFNFVSWAVVATGQVLQSMRVVDDRVFLLYPNYVDPSGKDVVREQIAGMTVVEKNHRASSGYYVFEVTPEGVRLSSVRAQ